MVENLELIDIHCRRMIINTTTKIIAPMTFPVTALE